MSLKQYRVWCVTDSRNEYALSETEPTQCPVNPAHTIDAAKTAAVDDLMLQSPKAYDAIVDAAGKGDYSSIKEAFDEGMKSVFVRPGTYVETGDIIIPEDGALEAASPGSVMIVFAGPYSVKIDGTARATSTGTISVATGGQIVTGVGTSFTALVAKDFIQLGAYWHQIDTVDSDLQVTLVNPYQGAALSGAAFAAQSMLLGAALTGIVIYGSSSQGLIIRQAMNVAVQKCYVTGNGAAGTVENALVENSAEIFFLGTLVKNGPHNGLVVRNTYVIQTATCSFSNNAGHGLVLDGALDTIIDACVMLQNGGCGLTVIGTTKRTNVTDSIASQNNTKGINTEPTTESTVIDSCTVSENAGHGVDFDGAKNIISNNVVYKNGGDGVLAGDYGVLSGNQISENVSGGINASNDQDCTIDANVISANGGIGIVVGPGNAVGSNRVYDNGGDGIAFGTRSDSVAQGNRVSGNAGYGVSIAVGGTDNIVGLNNLKGNTTGSLSDAGTGTLAVNNKV